jgi:hypothetical protein
VHRASKHCYASFWKAHYMRLKDSLIYRDILGTGIAFTVLLTATVLQLYHQGRIWWCACGQPFLWAGDIWSAHTSQHLFDPYSLTHVLHGVVFCGIILLAFPRLPLSWQLWMATGIEAFWEILENSQFIIHRYRTVTIGLGYEGDSIANSLSDISCCAFGFILAYYLGLRRSLAFFAVTELILLVWIRDNLTLNVLMLTWPIDAIKAWQMVH